MIENHILVYKIKSRILFFILLLSFNGIAQTIKLHYSGNKNSIINAVAEANKILADPGFYKRIDNIQKFDNSTYSGLQVANEMRSLNRTIEVSEYWNPFSKSNASTIAIIKINTAKLRRNLASITNTVIHESVHAVDWWTNNKWEYTHDGNSPNGQDKTAPWVIGAIAESMVN